MFSALAAAVSWQPSFVMQGSALLVPRTTRVTVLAEREEGQAGRRDWQAEIDTQTCRNKPFKHLDMKWKSTKKLLPHCENVPHPAI